MLTTIEPKFLLVHTGYEHKLNKSYIKVFNDLAEDLDSQFELVALKTDSKKIFDSTGTDILRHTDNSVAVFQVDENYMMAFNRIYLQDHIYCASYCIVEMKYDAENKILYLGLDSENG